MVKWMLTVVVSLVARDIVTVLLTMNWKAAAVGIAEVVVEACGGDGDGNNDCDKDAACD